MKKLYALLVFLIILYIGINVAATGLNLTDSGSASTADDAQTTEMGSAGFPKIANFTDSKVNDSAVRYKDSNNITINAKMIDNSKNISDIVNGLDQSNYTSSQTVDQNGVTAYFYYNEGSDTYSADIFFSKNNQNYMISGKNITYENSDYFINHCKSIIDSIGGSNKDSGALSRW